MGMSAGNGGGGPRQVLAEINVTPLVDVMLVLLIIMMVAAGVQTVELQAAHDKNIADAQHILDEAEHVRRVTAKHHKVGVDLPKVNADAVNLTEVKKLKLEVSEKLVFSIDETTLVDCLALSPEMANHLGAPTRNKEREAEQLAFAPCLSALGEKLVDNAKLQDDKELYVLADRRLDYGKVLRVMAAVRQAGVTKFGLVAEPGLLGDATTERTPEVVK